MSSGGWEAEDFIDEGEGFDDDDDLEDEVAVQTAPAPAPAAQQSGQVRSIGPRTPGARPSPGAPRHLQNGQPKRAFKVKPMPAGMRRKWPDVKSVLLTLDTGSQVMFVREA